MLRTGQCLGTNQRDGNDRQQPEIIKLRWSGREDLNFRPPEPHSAKHTLS